MRNSDILSMCLRNLFKRKLRTILTMLGVVIGTSAIVVTVSLGLAVDMRFQDILDGMGDAHLITVHDPANWWGWQDVADVEPPELDSATVSLFEDISGVESVLPVVNTNQLFFRSGVYTLPWATVMGVRPQALTDLGYQVAEGRLLQEGGTFEVVFGSNVPAFFINQMLGWEANQERMMNIWMGEEVEPFIDVFTDRIQMSYDWRFLGGHEEREEDFDFDAEDAPRPIRPITLQTVGVLESTGNWNTDEAIFMDIELVQRLIHDSERANRQDQLAGVAQDYGWGRIDARANVTVDTNYSMIYVRAEHIDHVSGIAEQIRDMGLPTHYLGQHLRGLQDMAATQQQMLGAVGVVSLLIAAIGIANTMVMSTYERTREIGVMKVIGASLKDIKKMFLTEAALIGFIGGIFGVLFSYLVSHLLNNYTDMAFMGGMADWWIGEGDAGYVSVITPWLSGLALVFSALIGLISGYFPARRATKLSALSAIRTE